MISQLKVETGPIAATEIPDHVPPKLVRDLRWAKGEFAVTYDEPYKDTGALLAPDVPRLLWSPDSIPLQPGVGAWIVSHYEDIARAYQDTEVFSSEGVAAFQSIIGETWPTIPIGIDAPGHMKYRAVLNPHFSPKAIDNLTDRIRATVNDLIDTFVEDGQVDFAHDFARVFPVRIFMDLMGFPEAKFEQFLEWEFAILHSQDVDLAVSALHGILAYLREFIAERKVDPGEDLTGKIVTSQVFGRPIDEDEILGMVWMLWLGGLDTVAATLGMMFRRLALNPDLQQKLRENPQMIPGAVEEFLRVQPLVISQRLVKKDFEWHGQQLRIGDWVQCMVTAGNFDPTEFECPREFQVDRQQNRHFTLAGGPHRCLGSHLARRELRVALEEWLRRVPPFRLAPDDERTIYPGLRAVRTVKLVW